MSLWRLSKSKYIVFISRMQGKFGVGVGSDNFIQMAGMGNDYQAGKYIITQLHCTTHSNPGSFHFPFSSPNPLCIMYMIDPRSIYRQQYLQRNSPVYHPSSYRFILPLKLFAEMPPQIYLLRTRLSMTIGSYSINTPFTRSRPGRGVRSTLSWSPRLVANRI
jgi:hypothetical protein